MDEHEGLRFFYFDVAHAINVHSWVIEQSGGLPGVKNLPYIESPLEHIKNDDYYPSIVEKVTHLVFSINKNHGFNDGNKRSSIALGSYLLELNGYDYTVKRFVHEMENVAVCIASNHIGKGLLHEIIASLVYEEDFSEVLKLQLIDAFSKFAQDKATLDQADL